MQQDHILPANNQDSNRPTPVASRPPRQKKRSFLPTLALLVAAPVVAFLITVFVFQSYEVDGPSMESTLHNADRLIVWKLPRTLAKITGNVYIPNRGDIVIFVKHGVVDLGSNGDKQLIKRVIGLPGDRVVVGDGGITLYNQEHPDGFNPDEGHEYSTSISGYTNGNVDLVVGKGEVFVVGDNRTNSLDSRSFGTVNSSDIVGKLVFRIFPVNNFDSY